MTTGITVIFHQVSTNAAKLMTICTHVKESFEAGQRVLIHVPTIEAATYIDQLLWRSPEESFIPHSIHSQPTQDHIIIAINPSQNLNQAQICWNLAPAIPSIANQFMTIHEFLDETDPVKSQLSLQRQAAYQQIGYNCQKQ